MSARTENFGLGIAPWGSLRVQAAPELLGGEDRRVRSLTPGTGRVSPGRGETELSASRPPPPFLCCVLRLDSQKSYPRPFLPRSQDPARTVRYRHSAGHHVLEGPAPRCTLHAARRPEPRRGFVFAGMRGCFVSPWGTRETRAAGRLPPLAATPASGHLLGLRPRAAAFVLYISIKLPRISRLNNSTQKESA